MSRTPSESESFTNVRPAQPPNLPSPDDHPTIQVVGLHAWFLQLVQDQTQAFLRYLFNWDLAEGTPDPSLYAQPISTVKLAACYDMSSYADQRSFTALVRWLGHNTVPDPPKEKAAPPIVPRVAHINDCYTAAVVPSSRAAMRAALGDNPWAVSVATYLLARSGEWNPGKVRLSVGLPCKTFSTMAYTQGHLEEHPDGMRVKELISHLSGFTRVGASAGDKLNITAPSTAAVAKQVPTVFDVKPGSAKMSLSMAVYFRVTASNAVGWTPFKTAAFVLILGVYESVRLTSAKFQITVPSGQNCEGMAAIVSPGKVMAGDEWYMAPILHIFPGSDNGAVMGSFELPAVHSWNTELRASVRGNPPPEFKFGLSAPAGKEMLVTGQFTVEVSGQAVIGAANGTSTSKLAAQVRGIQSSLSYPVADEHERAAKCDESDDDEPGPSRSSPPRALPPSARPPTQSAARSG